jgi:hypothetical protein
MNNNEPFTLKKPSQRHQQYFLFPQRLSKFREMSEVIKTSIEYWRRLKEKNKTTITNSISIP